MVQHQASIRPGQDRVHGFNFSEMQPQPALVRDKAQDLKFSAFWRQFLGFLQMLYYCRLKVWKSPLSIDSEFIIVGAGQSPSRSPSFFPPFVCLYLFHIKYFLSGVEMTNRGRIFKRNSGQDYILTKTLPVS